MSKRATPTETFQPTPKNSKRLARLKRERGLASATINKALDAFYDQTKNPLAPLIIRLLKAGHGHNVVSDERDFKLICELCGEDYREVSNGQLD